MRIDRYHSDTLLGTVPSPLSTFQVIASSQAPEIHNKTKLPKGTDENVNVSIKATLCNVKNLC